MIEMLRTPDLQQSHRLRLNTLIRLRWLAIVGQSVTVVVVAYWLDFPLPVSLCFALIACSAWLNLLLTFRYPAAHRLTPRAAFITLTFDALQLAGLLYMTGGLTNPFSLTQIFSLPYVFDSVEHMRHAADGEPGRVVLKSFEQRDLIGLAIYDAGTRSFYNVSRPVREPADLHGLKIRVPPSDIFIELARALGANPTPLPFGEVYSAMQTHLIDGAENNWRTLHTSRQFEVAQHWSGTHHSHSPEALLMSKRAFDALSGDDQALLLQLARESVPYMRSLWDRMEAESREHVLAAGIEVTEIDMPAFRRAAQPLLERYLESESLRSLYSQIRALA